MFQFAAKNGIRTNISSFLPFLGLIRWFTHTLRSNIYLLTAGKTSSGRRSQQIYSRLRKTARKTGKCIGEHVGICTVRLADNPRLTETSVPFFFHPADLHRVTYRGLLGIPTQLWHCPQAGPRVVQTTGSMHSSSLHFPIANSASTPSQQPV